MAALRGSAAWSRSQALAVRPCMPTSRRTKTAPITRPIRASSPQNFFWPRKSGVPAFGGRSAGADWTFAVVRLGADCQRAAVVSATPAAPTFCRPNQAAVKSTRRRTMTSLRRITAVGQGALEVLINEPTTLGIEEKEDQDNLQ